MLSLVVFVAVLGCLDARTVKHINKCGHEIWVSPLTNDRGPALRGGIQHLSSGKSKTYQIPDSGWSGRFWPKQGCSSKGQSCTVGQSIPPCGSKGCDPPAETKVEFTFPPRGSSKRIWYDVSLVDGYSLSTDIVPSIKKGDCKTAKCGISLNACPTNENDVGDLRVVKKGRVVMCLSPCKKWNSPRPFGMGKPDKTGRGLSYCCPTQPVSPAQCRAGPVTRTKYVTTLQRSCPTAYSYAYDDKNGLHTCPSDVSFTVVWCA